MRGFLDGSEAIGIEIHREGERFRTKYLTGSNRKTGETTYEVRYFETFAALDAFVEGFRLGKRAGEREAEKKIS